MRCAATILLCLTTLTGWAQDRIGQLPAGATEIRVRGDTYFYRGGYFYRSENGSYLQVKPPLGARVPAIPSGSTGFTIGSDHYFLFGNGAFFLYSARGNYYTVVSPPHNWRHYLLGAAGALPGAAGAYGQPLTPQMSGYPGYVHPGFSERAAREATCRQIASDISRRDSVTGKVSSRKLRIYKEEYLACVNDSSPRRR